MKFLYIKIFFLFIFLGDCLAQNSNLNLNECDKIFASFKETYNTFGKDSLFNYLVSEIKIFKREPYEIEKLTCIKKYKNRYVPTPKSTEGFKRHRYYHANLAFAYSNYFGNNQLAIVHYKKAINTHLEGKLEDQYLNYLYKPLANCYTRLGDYAKAEYYFEECKKYLIKFNDNKNLARLFTDMSIASKSKGDFRSSINYDMEALKMNSSNTANINSQLNLIDTYLQLNELNKADITITEIDSTFQSIIDEHKNTYINERKSSYYELSGDLATKQENFIDAKNNYNKAFYYLKKSNPNLSKREVGKHYLKRGKMYYKVSKTKTVISYTNRAIQSVIPDYDTTLVTPTLHQLYPENTIMEALALKAKAYELDYDNTRDFHKLEMANECYQTAIKVSELLRDEYIFNESEYIALQDNKSLIDASLNNYYRLYSTNQKDDYLIDIQKLLIDAKSNILEKKQNFTYALKKMTLEEKAQYNIITKKIDSLLILNITDTEYLEWLDKRKVFQKEQLLKYTRNTNLIDNYVDYFIGEKNTFAFTSFKDEKGFFKLGSRDSLLNLINQYKRILKQKTPQKNKNNFNDNTLALYNYLIAPLEPLPRNCIIVPDEEISKLSFDSFYNLNGLPLIMKYSFSYKYQALENTDTYTNKTNNKAVIFTPKYDKSPYQNITLLRDKLYEINGAKDEAINLQRILKGELYQESDANKLNFIKAVKNANILHFAGHAVLDSMTNGYLAFNSSTNKTQHIYTTELDTLNISVDLLTLSACNTASGKIQPGEGTFSLTRSFHGVGAKSIVSTLWEIPDQTSAEIMISFYYNLLKGMKKDDALRKAKIEYLENADPDYQHPYYWSGIIATGNMENLFRNSKNKYYLIIGIGIIVIMIFGKSKYFTKSKAA